jgi:predicted nucleotidyltransferase
MKCDEILARLNAAEPELRKRGIRCAGLFGSTARGKRGPDFDVDILLEFERGAEGSIYNYVRLKEFVAGLFEEPVDVVHREGLKPHLHASVLSDTVYAL